MKKFVANKGISKLLTLTVFAVVIASFFIPAIMVALGGAALFNSGIGVTLAVGTPITGPITISKTEAASADFYEQDISRTITEQMPNKFAIDTIMRRIRKPERAKNIKVEYEEVSVRPVSTATNLLFTAAGNSADATVALTLLTTAHLKADDILRVPSITGALNGKELKLLVLSVTSATVVSVTALNGANTDGRWVPTIANTSPVYRVASAKDELDAQTTVLSQITARDFNYCQSNMIQMEQSKWDSIQKSKSGYDYANKKRLEMYSFREELETSHIFGNRAKLAQADPDNPFKYVADGIVNKISKTITFGTGSGAVDIDKADILNMMKQVFVNNAGSESRLAVCGADVIEAVDNVAEFTRNLGKDEVSQVYGVNVHTFETSFGMLNLVHSDVLDRQGWGKKALILDLAHLIKKDYDPLNISKLELAQSGQRKVVNAYTIEEVSCITTRYSGADGVHAIWEPAP